MTSKRYVIITAARNEANYIGQTIQHVLAQTILPVQWIIASNGSTDATDYVIESYAKQTNFIKLLRLPSNPLRNFAIKSQALHAAYGMLKKHSFEFIANLDADITLDHDYYERILAQFSNHQGMGIASGIYLDKEANKYKAGQFDLLYPPGGIQVFRRSCYEAIGGYPLLPWGGEDTAACVLARLNGWEAQIFPEIQTFHQRPWGTGGGTSAIKSRYRQGKMDYHLGMHPIYSVMKGITRLTEKPLFIGSICRTAGYLMSLSKRERLLVSKEFVDSIRQEEIKKIRDLFVHQKSEGGCARHEKRFS